jgi:hypothetical protein
MRSIGAAAIAALIAVGLVSAQAADLPDKRILKAPPPPPLYGGVWIAAEYLIWSAKGDKLPALVTTSPAGTLQPQAGVLGAPGTSVLFGDDNVNDRWRSGARISAGYWFDPQRTKGIEANFFILHQNSTDFAASSNGTPILARPFIDATTGLQSAKLLAFPAFVSGSIAISDASRLLGAGAAYRMEICRNCALGSIGGLVGYRFLRLRDSLVIGDTSVSPLGAITSTDQFDTTNSFHGLDLGLTGEIATGPWRMTWLAKLAVGRTLTNVEISGAAVSTLYRRISVAMTQDDLRSCRNSRPM